MKYQLMTRQERDDLWKALEQMSGFLTDRLAALTPEEAMTSGPEGGLSPVEQCWHLADLEREGFGLRIRRLRTEADPLLPDFDGDRAAKERAYKSRSLAEGIEAFREARASNLATLRRLEDDQWSHTSTQEGVGRVALCDIPQMMVQHDASHRSEILTWLGGR